MRQVRGEGLASDHQPRGGWAGLLHRRMEIQSLSLRHLKVGIVYRKRTLFAATAHPRARLRFVACHNRLHGDQHTRRRCDPCPLIPSWMTCQGFPSRPQPCNTFWWAYKPTDDPPECSSVPAGGHGRVLSKVLGFAQILSDFMTSSCACRLSDPQIDRAQRWCKSPSAVGPGTLRQKLPLLKLQNSSRSCGGGTGGSDGSTSGAAS